jgi:predicted ATPase
VEKFEAAVVAIRHARDIAEETDERWCFADVQRVGGEILLSMDSPDEDRATQLFADAQASARQTQSRSFELRAATSLAGLLQRQGKDQEAVGVLAPIYDWFEEGFATADLKRAGALLATLREVTPSDGR